LLDKFDPKVRSAWLVKYDPKVYATQENLKESHADIQKRSEYKITHRNTQIHKHTQDLWLRVDGQLIQVITVLKVMLVCMVVEQPARSQGIPHLHGLSQQMFDLCGFTL
jgi:hypothetical protein